MFMIRSDLVNSSVEAGLMVTYNQKLWIGANYRNQDAGSVLLGTNLLGNTLRLGYALDIVTTGANAKSGTSHELFLRYVLNPVKMGKKSVVKTPRYSL
ncbi:Bacteroidetes-specific putative membrane protein [compost metagenome]